MTTRIINTTKSGITGGNPLGAANNLTDGIKGLFTNFLSVSVARR